MTASETKEARLNAGLSASEAAALVGVKTVTWQRWEGFTLSDSDNLMTWAELREAWKSRKPA